MTSSDDPSRVLVTGASGNLACRLIALLRAEGLHGARVQLVLTDLQPPSGFKPAADMIFEAADLCDPAALRRLVHDHRPQFLLHFGSLLSGACERDLARAWQINATAPIILLEAAAQLDGCVFFFPSTGATYGFGVPDPLPEDYPQWPENFYGAMKVAVERAGACFRAKRGLDFRGVRLPMVLSPSAPAAAVSAYASRAFVEARSGRPFVFPVSPETGISTIYIKDVIEGFHRLLSAPPARLSRGVYNLHSFDPTAADIAAAIRRHVPDFVCSFQPDPFVDRLLGGWPRVQVDASARADWGWAPRFNLETAAADLLAPRAA
jgi:threonine 3-dehydrogenase